MQKRSKRKTIWGRMSNLTGDEITLPPIPFV